MIMTHAHPTVGTWLTDCPHHMHSPGVTTRVCTRTPSLTVTPATMADVSHRHCQRADGRPAWSYELGDTCVGTLVIVETSAPDADDIDEFRIRASPVRIHEKVWRRGGGGGAIEEESFMISISFCCPYLTQNK